jgi:hypothetical protein
LAGGVYRESGGHRYPAFPVDKDWCATASDRLILARRSCSNKKIERDDDSKKSHPALVALQVRAKAAVMGRP